MNIKACCSPTHLVAMICTFATALAIAAEPGTLMQAVLGDDLQAARSAIEGGAPVDAIDPVAGHTPLYAAVSPGGPRYRDMIELLISKGAGLDVIDATTQLTPLVAAMVVTERGPFAQLERSRAANIVDALLNGGANPNQVLKGGESPLMLAVSMNNLSVVQLLLARGANPNLRDANQSTALHVAYATERPASMIDALTAAGANPNLRDAQGKLPHELSPQFVPVTPPAPTQAAPASAAAQPSVAPAPEPPKSSMTKWLIGGAVVATAVVGSVVLAHLVKEQKKKKANGGAPGNVPSAPPPVPGVQGPVIVFWLNGGVTPANGQPWSPVRCTAAAGVDPNCVMVREGDIANLMVEIGEKEGPAQRLPLTVQLSSSEPGVFPVPATLVVPPRAAGQKPDPLCTGRNPNWPCIKTRVPVSVRVGAIAGIRGNGLVNITASIPTDTPKTSQLMVHLATKTPAPQPPVVPGLLPPPFSLQVPAVAPTPPQPAPVPIGQPSPVPQPVPTPIVQPPPIPQPAPAPMPIPVVRPQPQPVPPPTPVVTCAAPQILQNGACVTAPPVPTVAARIKDFGLMSVKRSATTATETFILGTAAESDRIEFVEGDSFTLYLDIDDKFTEPLTVRFSASEPNVFPVPAALVVQPNAAGFTPAASCRNRASGGPCPQYRLLIPVRIGKLEWAHTIDVANRHNVSITAVAPGGSKSIAYVVAHVVPPQPIAPVVPPVPVIAVLPTPPTVPPTAVVQPLPIVQPAPIPPVAPVAVLPSPPRDIPLPQPPVAVIVSPQPTPIAGPAPPPPPLPIAQPTPQPSPPPASAPRMTTNPADLATFLAQPATPATRAISVRWTAPAGVVVDEVAVTYTWFCASGLQSKKVLATQEPDSPFAMARWFAPDQPAGCPEGVFPPSQVVIAAQYRINRAGPAYSVSLLLPGSLPPPPAGTTTLASANSFDAAAYPYVTYVASCFAGVGRPATKSSLQALGGPCMSAARNVTTGEYCGSASGYTQSSLLQNRAYLSRCLASNSTGQYRNNYLQSAAGFESQVAAIDACPAGYTRNYSGPCVKTSGSAGSGGSAATAIYELGGRQVNPYTAAAYFETNCLQIASKSAYKLAYEVYGATYFQQSLHATKAECEAAGKAWVANGGKSGGAAGGAAGGAGGATTADSGSTAGGGGTNAGGYQCATTKKPFDPDWIQSHGSYWAAASAHDAYAACLKTKPQAACQDFYVQETKLCNYAKPACLAVATSASSCPG